MDDGRWTEDQEKEIDDGRWTEDQEKEIDDGKARRGEGLFALGGMLEDWMISISKRRACRLMVLAFC